MPSRPGGPHAMDVFDKCYRWPDAQLARAAGIYPYFQPIDENLGTEVVVNGRRLIMAGSNSYLGLATDSRVKAAAAEAVNRFGASCSGSRSLNGSLALHEALEARLAVFLRKEAALAFSTGFQTNLGTIPPLVGKGDVVFIDKHDHASIVDGARLSGAEVRRFRHNDAEHLERLLRDVGQAAGKLIVVDGIFSMEGDVADLPAIVAAKQRHGARLIVDDAHGFGVMGAGGRGTAEHFGVEPEVDLVVATFSKSLGSLGGVVAGPAEVVDWIKHKSRPLIFSASMTPAAVGACLKSLDIMEAEPERRERLWRNADKMREGFRALGFNIGVSATPVIPILVGDDQRVFTFRQELLDAGVFANAVVRPAVRPGAQLIRTSFMATHTDAQLDRVLDIFEAVGRRLGILSARTLTAAAR